MSKKFHDQIWRTGAYTVHLNMLTLKGVIRVRHEKQSDGLVKSTIDLLPGIEQLPTP